MSPRRTIIPLLAAALLAPVGLAACGDDSRRPAGSVLDRDQLETDISARLQKAGAGTAPPVTCPSDLPTQKDAAIRCKATISGDTLRRHRHDHRRLGPERGLRADRRPEAELTQASAVPPAAAGTAYDGVHDCPPGELAEAG